MKSTLIAAALILSAGIALYLTFRDGGNGVVSARGYSNPGSAESSGDDRGDRDEQLIQLQRQVALLTQEMERRKDGAVQRVPAQPFRQPSAVEVRAFRQRAIGQYDVTFKGGIASPTKDARMRSDAIEAIDAADIASLATPPTEADVDCRGEMCKLAGNFSSESEADAWATYYVMHIADQFPSTRYFLERGPSGKTVIRLYLFSPSGARLMAGIDRGLH